MSAALVEGEPPTENAVAESAENMVAIASLPSKADAPSLEQKYGVLVRQVPALTETNVNAAPYLVFKRNRQVTVGRMPVSTYVITDPVHSLMISRVHAFLEHTYVPHRQRHVYTVRDNNSTNGVCINGVRAESAQLGNNDTVVFGYARLGVQAAALVYRFKLFTREQMRDLDLDMEQDEPEVIAVQAASSTTTPHRANSPGATTETTGDDVVVLEPPISVTGALSPTTSPATSPVAQSSSTPPSAPSSSSASPGDHAEQMERARADGEEQGATAAAASLIDTLEDECSCSICQDWLVSPVLLPCSHSFCTECIEMWLEKKKECPACRTAVPSTPLLTNRTVANMISVLMQRASPEIREAYEERVRLEASKKLDIQDEMECEKLRAKLAKMPHVQFFKINTEWQAGEATLFQAAIGRYNTPKARRLYCELTGFTEAWVRTATPALLRRALINLRRNYTEKQSVVQMRNELLRVLMLPTDPEDEETQDHSPALSPGSSSSTALSRSTVSVVNVPDLATGTGPAAALSLQAAPLAAPVVVTVPDAQPRPQGGRDSKRARSDNTVITID